MIEMRIESVRVSLMSPNQVVILKELDGDRRLPIFIGKPEGDSITFRLNEIPVPRPLTHDLATSILGVLDAKVVQVVITDLRAQHFFATIQLESEGTELTLDARPSDALAVAVRADCPIYIEEHVLDEAGVTPPSTHDEAGQENIGPIGAFDDFISSLDLSDLSDKDK